MSRLGKLPIEIPSRTEIKFQDDFIIAKGPKGELKQKLNSLVNVEIKDKEDGSGQEVRVSIKNDKDKKSKSMWGLYRQLIKNMIDGVNKEFVKQLEIKGVGYRASISGDTLTLNVGYSHSIDFKLPTGISVKVEKNIITISGIDKQLVGEVAAQIRRIRKPEPYKGKGIRYIGEVVRRKVGKAAVGTDTK